VGACQAEGSSCEAGEAVDCTPLEPTDEVCDGEDNDCDGLIDDGIEVQSCGVGECLVVIPGCASGDTAACEPLAPSDEICDGLDNNCNSQIDDDAFCVGGLCVAGRCVTADELGLGGNSGFPDDYDEDDVERWLSGTAGAAMGGASSLDPNDYKPQRSVDRGSCAVHSASTPSSRPLAWLLLTALSMVYVRRRKAG
jgi:MYXO-CTERM domain-containing protein